MLRVDVDMAKLNRSIRRASKNFGDTTKTAVARWGVSTARELAMQTQPWGNGGTRKTQLAAIESGMRAVVQAVDARTFRAAQRNRTRKTLESPGAIIEWVDEHRGSKGHARLSGGQKALCKKADFNKALRARKLRGGMAKGAWLGAGMEIARRQRGARQISIGKNFLGWTQKHKGRGEAKRSGTMFRPSAELRNKAKHTSSSYVVKKGHMKKAVMMGGRKTLTWYRRAAKAALDKA